MYFFKKPFAENGDKTQIPVNPQGDGKVSYTEGWAEGYELDAQTNPDEALELSRTNFNGLFNNITTVLQQIQKFGVNPYITSADNGGEPFEYPEGGVCSYTDPATNDYGVYYSIRGGNTTVPSENGITGKFWQKIASKDWDVLKSNRVSNVPLYYTDYPSYTVDDDTLSISVYGGTRILLPNGVNSDGSLKNEILQLTNDAVEQYTLSSQLTNGYFFIDSNERLLILEAQNYCTFTSETMVKSFLGDVSTDYDVYYFDADLNKWRYRPAGELDFIDLSYSMVQIGSFSANNSGDISFSYVDTLRLVDDGNFARDLGEKQQSLKPTKYINFSNSNDGSQIMTVDLPTTAVPFCANAGNVNSDGNEDLFSSSSVVNVGGLRDAFSYMDTNLRVVADVAGSNNTTGKSNPRGLSCSNPMNAFGENSGVCSLYYAYNYGDGNETKIMTATLLNPVEVSDLGCKFQCRCTNNYLYHHNPGHELYYYNMQWSFRIYFNDGTSVYKITPAGSTGWFTYEIDLSSYANKKITKIDVYNYNYMYNHCYGWWQWWLNSTAYISGIRIINKKNEIEQRSNKIHLKSGSNYYEVLSASSTPFINNNGQVTSSNSTIYGIWGGTTPVEIPIYIDEFSTTFKFNSTPAETNNCKLFLRYVDTKNNQILGGLNIRLTYFGGATYDLLTNKILHATQDLLLDVPNGKYIESITISASQMDYLQGVKFGMVQLFNNVSSSVASTLTQYPSLQVTSANTDRTRYNIGKTDDIEVNTSGYIMAGLDGIYILPGTNVIRKQKKEPTISDDPALRDGDIWLDYSSEPIMAYQRVKGQWEIFDDVPVGYVNLFWSEPTATATKVSSTITSVSVVASQFATKEENSGTYYFVYDGSKWLLSDEEVQLSAYGISIQGTATAEDSIVVVFTASESSIYSIQTYKYNQNGYNINTFTENIGSLTGRDGRDGQNGRDGKNGTDGERGQPGIGIPSGGRRGQILTKMTSNADYITEWTDVVNNSIFNGGTTGQSLVKSSNDDLQFEWKDILPAGGNIGDALIKTENGNEWGSVQVLPEGGFEGQFLAKSSDDSFAVQWVTPVFNTDVISEESDFQLSAFQYGIVNGYRQTMIEKFKNGSVIKPGVEDGDIVISDLLSTTYHRVYNNLSEEIKFVLNPVDTSDFLHLAINWTGSDNGITVEYSADGVNFNEVQKYEDFATLGTTAYVRITLSSGSYISDLAIFAR